MKKSVIIILIISGIVAIFRVSSLYFSRQDGSSGPAAVPVRNATSTATVPIKRIGMIITSPSFEDGGNIPAKFTCAGGNINPELQVQNVPPSARSLTLIVEDSDVASGTFTHWVVWNIDPKTSAIKQESVPPGSVEGANNFGSVSYKGPCPPVGQSHHYHFKLYAVDATLNLPEGSLPAAVIAQMNKYNIVANAELVGLYP